MLKGVKACENHNLELIKYIHQEFVSQNVQLPSSAYEQIQEGTWRNDNVDPNKILEIIKYLHQNGCNWSTSKNTLYDLAAIYKIKDLLDYIIENKLPIYSPPVNFTTFMNAASRHKDLEILKRGNWPYNIIKYLY